MTVQAKQLQMYHGPDEPNADESEAFSVCDMGDGLVNIRIETVDWEVSTYVKVSDLIETLQAIQKGDPA